jgi:ketosteroid isomerase-like protein
MLTGRAQDLEGRLAEHEAGAERGSAHWLADYTFSTGRRVRNDIHAQFRFEDGLIAGAPRLVLVLPMGT